MLKPWDEQWLTVHQGNKCDWKTLMMCFQVTAASEGPVQTAAGTRQRSVGQQQSVWSGQDSWRDLSHFRETGKEDYKQLANLNIINLNIYQARWYCFFGVEEIAIVHRSALWHVSSVMSCLAVSIRLALLPAWHIGYSTATCLWLLVNEEQIKCVFIEHMVSILKLPSTRASIVSCYVACIT